MRRLGAFSWGNGGSVWAGGDGGRAASGTSSVAQLKRRQGAGREDEEQEDEGDEARSQRRGYVRAFFGHKNVMTNKEVGQCCPGFLIAWGGLRLGVCAREGEPHEGRGQPLGARACTKHGWHAR